MHVPSISAHPRALRWLAPVGVVGVAALAATGAFNATASSDDLPKTTPAALIAAVQSTPVDEFSGTVVSHLALGLPELPALAGADEPSSFASLLSGSHTMQVWYGGSGQQRVALLGATDETDLFRNGTDLWQWSSADQVAVHTTLPVSGRTPAAAPTSTSSLTPDDLARNALHALDPSTVVTIDENHTVADRAAYELVLTPRTAATKVGSVHISVDGATKMPLGVQIYPRNATSPAVDVAYTNIRFAKQPERNFDFTPPPNAKVHENGSRSGGSTSEARTAQEPDRKPKISGSAWTTVVDLDPGQAAVTKLIGPLRKAMTAVSGAWGNGRLLESSLVSVLVTSDGRVLFGAVAPDELYAAAGSR